MKKAYQFLFIIIVVLFVQLEQVNALGISPSPIIRNNVINGVRIPGTVTITRGSSIGDELVEVSISGESGKYLELSKEKIIIPDGKSRLDYTFYIAPKTAPNGEHTAYILFIKKGLIGGGKTGGGTGAVLEEAMMARIVFTVTDQEVVEIKIGDVFFSDVEVGLPLLFSFYMRNDGNVDVRPDRLYLEMTDITDEKHSYSKEFTQSDFDLLLPGENITVSLIFLDSVPQGEYNANAKFYLKNEIIREESNIKIEVLPPGSLGQGAEFTVFKTEKNIYNKDELVEFNAEIVNTGQIGIKSVFFLEIYQNDSRQDLVRSSDKFILKGRTGLFRENYRFLNYGDYRVDAYFEYGASRTEKKSLNISIPKPVSVGVGWGANNIIIVVGIVLFLSLIIIVLILFIKKRRGKNKIIHKQKKNTFKRVRNPIKKTSRITKNRKASAENMELKNKKKHHGK